MAKTISLKIEFDPRKLDALQMVLEKKEKILEIEVTEYIEKLYNQNVHESLREYLDKDKR